jgi:tetratricopeptide (TPR) repeat protein
MNIRLVTVIWGADFVSMFLRIGLRSLLAEGNLIDLARRHQVIYTIYTTEEDMRLIEGSPFFTHLRQFVNVQFSFFTKHEIDSAHYGSHNVLWQRGVEVARRNKEILFFLIPDLLYARRTLLRWASRFEEGCRALYTPGPQVVLETILPEVEEKFPLGTEPITLESTEITQLLLSHLHPMHAGMMRQAQRRVPFAEYDIRPIRGYGFVLREQSSQPFCIDIAYFERLTNFNPTDHLDAIRTEPCSTLSVEPLFKRVEWYYRPWKLDATRLTQLGGWWDYFGPPGCVKDSETAHVIIRDAGDSIFTDKVQAIDGGRFFRAQMAVSTRQYQLVFHLRELGLRRSAEILSLAMYAARLRRRVNLSGDFVLMVPNNDAFERIEDATLKRWLAPGRESELIDILKDHILPGGQAGSMDSWKTARGFPIQPLARSAKVVDGPITEKGFCIYIVDRILDRDAVQSLNVIPAAANEQNGSISVGALSPASGGGMGPWGYPALVFRFRLLKWAYIAFYVPLLETVLAIPFYFHARWRGMARWLYRLGRYGFRLLRDFLLKIGGTLVSVLKPQLRKLYLRLRLVPKIGRTMEIALQVYRLWRSDGKRAILRLVISYLVRYSMTEGIARRMIYLETGVSRVKLAVMTKGILGAVKWGYLEVRRRFTNWMKISPKVSNSHLQLLGKVQIARSLLAMSNVLKEYEDATLPAGLHSSPRHFVEKILEINNLTTHDSNKFEEKLFMLAKQNPRWAECWLELGYLALDNSDFTKALKYFERASRAHRISSSTDYVDPCSLALTECARILRAVGGFGDASTNYSTSLSRDPRQSVACIEYAQLLRETGREIESLEYFSRGVSFEETKWSLPKTIRDARQIQL